MTKKEQAEIAVNLAEKLLGYTWTDDPDATTETGVRLVWMFPTHKCVVSHAYQPKHSDRYHHQWENFDPCTDSADAMAVLAQCIWRTGTVSIKFEHCAQVWILETDNAQPTITIRNADPNIGICLLAEEIVKQDP